MSILPPPIKRKVDRVMSTAVRVHELTGENKYYLFCDVLYNWFRFGCSDEDYLTMEFYRKNAREKRRWMTSKKNNRWLVKKAYDKYAIETFDNKDKFDKVFKEYMKHDFIIAKEHTKDEVIAFIEKYGSVIVKPTDGACGMGVFKINSKDKQEVNQLLYDIENGKNLILEEVIIQHPDMAKMNPNSVNTLRIITMLDRMGRVHIIDTLAKFGGSGGCISNTFGGGVCCHVDRETGIVDGKGHDIHGLRLFRHPVSGVVIPGYRIPRWSGIIEYVIKLAKVVPSARYIGWDIVVLENDYDVIEGNIHPGQDFQACNGYGRWNDIKDLL